jgi:GT2 family glycosyltransferase
MLLSVIVVNYRAKELLLECLTHLDAAIGQLVHGVEVIVVDNAANGTAARAVNERYPGVIVIEERKNTGFAPAVARALGRAAGQWVALVNNDANVAPNSLVRLLAAGEADPSVGAVAAQVRFASRPDVLNSAGIAVDRLGIAWERLAGQPVSASEASSCDVFGASGCVALYRRAMIDAVGGFDATFFAYLEDVDLAWRSRANGWRCVYEPGAVAYHQGSATAREGSAFKFQLVGRNRMRLLAKNATAAQLLRYGMPMLVYDLAYVTFAGMTGRTLAPLRGRLAGLREWRVYRRAGARSRRPVPLAPMTAGWRGALGQWRAYRRGQAS